MQITCVPMMRDKKVLQGKKEKGDIKKEAWIRFHVAQERFNILVVF